MAGVLDHCPAVLRRSRPWSSLNVFVTAENWDRNTWEVFASTCHQPEQNPERSLQATDGYNIHIHPSMDKRSILLHTAWETPPWAKKKLPQTYFMLCYFIYLFWLTIKCCHWDNSSGDVYTVTRVKSAVVSKSNVKSNLMSNLKFMDTWPIRCNNLPKSNNNKNKF